MWKAKPQTRVVSTGSPTVNASSKIVPVFSL
jgi:hypothetical protein